QYVTSIPGANWEDIGTFTGYEFSWTNSGGVCSPANPATYGFPRAPLTRPFLAPNRRGPSDTSWVSLGGLPRFLGSSPNDGIDPGDPRDVRYYGGTRCDANTAGVGVMSGDGNWIFGSAYKAALTRTNPCGEPGIGFGLCGDFQPYAWNAGTGMVELPVSQPFGSVIARIDSANGDGTVVCGYDQGVSPDPDGGLTTTTSFVTVPVTSSVVLQPGQTYWIGFQCFGAANTSLTWGVSALPASSVNLAQRLTSGANTNWLTPTGSSIPSAAPAIRLTGNDGNCGVTLIDTFNTPGGSGFNSGFWNVTTAFNRAVRFTVPANSAPVTLCSLNVAVGAATGLTSVLASVWADSGTGTLPANAPSIIDIPISGPLSSFSGWRATAWRRNPATNAWTRALLDPYGYPNPGMVTNTGGGMPRPANQGGGTYPTFIALGLTPQGTVTTFNPPSQWGNPAVSGATLSRWTFDPAQSGNAWGGWVPFNMGRPADVLNSGGSPIAPERITPSLMSRDGQTVLARVEYGGVGMGAQAIRNIIWSPAINAGVPTDFNDYLTQIGVPAVLGQDVTMGLPMQISVDGNALQVQLTDDRDYCPDPSVRSLFTGASAVLYLNGTNVPCEAPRIVAPLNDTLDYTGIGVTGFGAAVNCFASGSWPLEYQWQKETAPNSNQWVDLTESCNGFQDTYQWEYEGTRKNQLRIGLNLNVANHSGRYRVRVSNSCGTVFSEPALYTFAVGACCFERPGTGCRECTIRTEYDCGGTFGQFGYRLGGTFGGVGSTCSPATCADLAVGRCENFFSVCEVTCANKCSILQGTFTLGGTCNAPTSLVCCRGVTCAVVTDAAACTAPAGVGVRLLDAAITGCTGQSAVNSGCCYADFNKSGAKDVADIFAFLSAWFANSPFSDVGGDGTGTRDVSDIFQFLSAWFAGCT
ncbi:MAG: hypothetical protein K2Q20_07480, partial [Phycisphaerales bacterium]|nr:hypothetical protein [Phycisphaerales bacterium]